MGCTAFKGNPVPFCDGNCPTTVFRPQKCGGCCTWDKAKDFITRALAAVIWATIIIWFFRTFDIRINVVADSSASMLQRASAENHCARVRAAGLYRLARLYGSHYGLFHQREVVVSTIAVLTGYPDLHPLTRHWAPFSRRWQRSAFLTFTLL